MTKRSMQSVSGGFSLSELMSRPALRAAMGLALLCVFALFVSPRIMSFGSLISMAPFIGILGIATIGQHLVIQQRGFDLSVAGMISLAAVIVTVFTPADAGVGLTIVMVFVALITGVLGGVINGLFINFIGVPSLVMTIGLNALLLGFAYFFTNAAVHPAPPPLVAAATIRIGSLSILFPIFIVTGIFCAWVVARTRLGREFILTAVSSHAAHALGVKVKLFNIAAYAVAGFLFALAGVMVAGLVVTPNIQSGGPYMLMTVAAVIVGGSPLNGDRGSVVASMIGAVFLVFLNQLVVSMGFGHAIQSIVQAAIILVGVTVPSLLQNFRKSGNRPSKSMAKPSSMVTAAHKTDVVTAPTQVSNAILELSGVQKRFGNTIALAGVDFSAAPGEVHAIIGENGAGKSTLISVAAGVFKATQGEIRIDGKVMDRINPNIFREAGISVAFQHPPLPPHLTVKECFALMSEKFGQSGGSAAAQALLDRVTKGSLKVGVSDQISDLSIGQRHVIEIARALASNPKILVLDEPTEPFKEDDVAQLFDLIRELKAEGVAIVYISHRIHEVEEIADRISILRDGELIDSCLSSEISRAEIIDKIVGRPLGQVFPDKLGGVDGDKALFSVNNLSSDAFHEISFEAKKGEIIGIAGVEGQGQRELIRALGGLEAHTGTVEIAGTRLNLTDRANARNSGVAFVPDDRHHEGLFLSLSVRENLGVGYREAGDNSLLINNVREDAVVCNAIDALNIRTASAEALISSLSGGNQQKVLMGREIAAAPRVLLTDEPTKGVDIGSKSDIYSKLRELAAQGVTVIVSSSDGAELEGLCDRVLVMARGTVVKELTGDHVSDSEITAANLTGGETAAKRLSEHEGGGILSRALRSKWLPAIALSLASFVIIFLATSANSRFLSEYNLSNIQVQLATLALIAFGQLFVMMLGEIDFSVGPLAGLAVVLASYWIPDGASTEVVIFAAIAIVLVSTLIGLLQGLLVVILNLPSIVITLTGFFALQGVSLLLRPIPGGIISNTFVDAFLYQIGSISLVTIVVVVCCILFERVLFHRPFGRSLRASGSDRVSAAKLGVNRNRITPIAFAINGALVGVAGLILAATVGVGTGTAGINFTLMSITAVVLGGAVISGGFGSFISTLFGVVLVQMTFSATAFMQAGVEWQYWLIGISTLFAAGLFSLGRAQKKKT